MTPIRVVIADDHPVFRDGLRAALASTPGIEVVGEAVNGADAVEVTSSLRPDVVVMDVQMPGMNGLEAARAILEAAPETGVLVLTMFEDDDTVFAALRSGARGYLLKGAEQPEIARAIVAVASGEAIFGPGIAQRVVEYFSTRRGPPEAFPQLTARERELLDLIASGQGNQTIARRLSLSPKTVRNHVSNILTKLQVADRTQAIIRAREAGLGKPDPTR